MVLGRTCPSRFCKFSPYIRSNLQKAWSQLESLWHLSHRGKLHIMPQLLSKGHIRNSPKQNFCAFFVSLLGGHCPERFMLSTNWRSLAQTPEPENACFMMNWNVSLCQAIKTRCVSLPAFFPKKLRAGFVLICSRFSAQDIYYSFFLSSLTNSWSLYFCCYVNDFYQSHYFYSWLLLSSR